MADSQVKVYPPVVEFFDAESHCIHQMKLVVRNHGKSSKFIKFICPSDSSKFSLLFKDNEKQIAPGLEMNALIEYYTEKEEDTNDHLYISSGSDMIEVPLFAFSPKPILSVKGDLDFGTIIADGKIYTKDIAILNHGSKQGHFKISKDELTGVTVTPTEGLIFPGYSQPVRIEFMSKDIGLLQRIVSIHLEGAKEHTSILKANVVASSLQVLSKDMSEVVECIRFGSTYYGTDVVYKCYLYNSSPRTTSFVVQIDETGTGQELGIDTTKSILHTANIKTKCVTQKKEASSLISISPVEGTLKPFEKVELYFIFSPGLIEEAKGWKSNTETLKREDYAMFVSIHSVDGCVESDGTNIKTKTEIALTGTALPILLSLLPSPTIHFKDCIVGKSTEETIKLRNDSADLPICYAIRSVAHFHAVPAGGYIKASDFVDISFCFQPNQIGNLKSNLLVEVIGQLVMLNRSSPPVYKKRVIGTYSLLVSGRSPAVVNQSHIKQTKSLNCQENVSMHVWHSKDTIPQPLSTPAIKDCKILKENKKQVAIAHPNDLSCSIRPSNPKECIKTYYTKKERYTYVDPDYSYTDQENKKREAHAKTYVDLLLQRKQMRTNKKEAIEFKKYNNKVDLGMKPGCGLNSPKPSLKEIIDGNQKELPPSKKEILHDTFQKKRSINKSKSAGHRPLELQDCNYVLTPQELFMIKLEPNGFDFGDVCAKSIAQKQLKIINNIDKPISIQFNIDCKELRQTSPLLQLIPPNGTATLDIIIETSKLMNFYRNVSYVINGHHEDHIIVKANIVTVGLELSTNDIKLTPIQGMPVESGFRQCIELVNKKNMAAEFHWIPVDSLNISFSIRPAKGVVEAYSSLLCEVVFYPSYSSIFQSKFVLQVEGGNKSTLNCSAEVAPTSCNFLERRIMFGCIPLNLTTKKSVFIKNTSQHHSYFKILNNTPIEGMVVTPEEGSVPVGGVTELQVSYKPTDIMKFDTEILVDVLGWKSIPLRMGGEVELPSIDLSVDLFNFAGVHCGSTLSIPFTIRNLARSPAMLVMDLSNYKDFTVSAEDENVNEDIDMDDGFFCINIAGQCYIKATLNFSPTEVASYNFILPVAINHVLATSPPPSPYPASVAATRSLHTISPTIKSECPYVFDFPTPSRQVKATGLRAPLQFSTKSLEFALPHGYFDMNIQSAAGREKIIEIKNNGPDPQTFSFDLNHDDGDQIKNGIFKFTFLPSNTFVEEDSFKDITISSGDVLQVKVLFCPVDFGKYHVEIPIVLSGKSESFTYVTLQGRIARKQLYFMPEQICFDASPLDIERKVQFSLYTSGYQQDEELLVTVPMLEVADGSKEELLQVKLESNTIKQHIGDRNQPHAMSGEIKFVSRKPVSFSTNIIFNDAEHEYYLPVKGCADNSLLTTHSFLTNTQEKYHIVCEKYKSNKCDPMSTETMLVPCVSPIRGFSDVSMTTSSTTFTLESTSYLNSSLVSSSTYTEGSRVNATVDFGGFSMYQTSENIFPEADTLDGKYLKEVLKVLQRWYSSQAWSNSVCPLKIPSALYSCFSDVENKNTSRAGSWRRGKNSYSKSIFDIVSHLACKPIPGIPSNPTFSTKHDERVHELLTLYENLLTFLRCQGASVSLIEPAYLLDRDDFSLIQKIGDTHITSSFELMSRKTWSILLLQVIKTLVLVRVSPQSYSKMLLPDGYPKLPSLNPDPLCSNVYSVHERILLAWLNIHFEQQRNDCWKYLLNVEPPASRWIVNFDHDFVDGLVLASLIAAYAPYIIKTHLHDLYTHPNSAEQCLHNALKVSQAITFLGLDYDIVATDITEPVSLNLLLLVTYLYHSLPPYTPKSNIEINGLLHGTATKLVNIQNPSNKSITYQAILAGEYAKDFTLPSGDIFQIPSKDEISLAVNYTSRFLRPCEGVLILVGKRTGGGVGTTTVFRFNCLVGTILPSNIVKCIGPCYELQKIKMAVCNPYSSCATFKVLLIESSDVEKIKPVFPKHKVTKEISSKIDNRKKKRNTLKKVDGSSQPNENENNKQKLSAFWCPASEIFFNGYESKEIEIHFLPFDIGNRQCSVLFLNENIGEFLYSIEAESTLPLPLQIPFYSESSRPSSRISNCIAMKHTDGRSGNDDCSIYLHCEAEKFCFEELQIPVANSRKEQAMAIASRQRMSEKELVRRDLTGVTSSETIIASMSKLQLQQSKEYIHPVDILGLKGPFQECFVDVTSPYFETERSICIPLSENISGTETFSLPLNILANPPGQYSCDIVMKGANDFRVYHVECLMRYKDLYVELQFESAAHQSILQNIPVANQSPIDWHFNISIKGDGFTGPETFFVAAKNTSMYPLSFCPIFEGPINGELIMYNNTTQAETTFILSGHGLKPNPLNTYHIDCIVNEPTMKVLEIENTMPYKMVFEAFSDVDNITGPRFITVLPRQTVQVPIKITALKRGYTECVVFFIYDEEYVMKMGLARPFDEDSDDEDDNDDKKQPFQKTSFISDTHSKFPDISESKKFKKPYRLWYSLNISSLPNAAEKRFEVSCAVHSTCSIEVLLNNPLDDELKLNAIVDGFDLYGDPFVCIPAKSSFLYQLTYTPTFVGKGKASLVFQSELAAEFWYDLCLLATQPDTINLPIMQCELGRSSKQSIILKNPSISLIEYHVTCSNTNNFHLQIDDNTIAVEGQSELEIPLVFTPSNLGLANHQAEIIFENNEVCRQVFSVNGRGEPPLVYNDHVINAQLGGNASTIVVFRNPFDDDIVVDVKLKQRISSAALGSHNNWDTSLFSLLLKTTSGIVLKPRATLDLPISYAPDTMQKHEANCIIMTKKHLQNYNEENRGSQDKLTWTYNIQGIPISIPVNMNDAPVFKCRARERIEEKFEISFANINVSTAQTHILASYRPIRKLSLESIESQSSMDNFNESITYELSFDDAISESNIKKSAAINLTNKLYDNVTGIVTLLFELILFPSRSFSHVAFLTITSPRGGVWKYPLKFVSSEPTPDDTIVIQSSGLAKEAYVSFRLFGSSLSEEDSHFEAKMMTPSDFFKVNPTSGILSSDENDGTLFTVIFKPTSYGKKHKARLLIETNAFQWIYDIHGVTPDYIAPTPLAAIDSGRINVLKKYAKRKNHIRDNLRVGKTAVSSPIKRTTLSANQI